jgi:ubiquinone/menaquinone biosynthesis C-methylase UbiE
MNSQPNVRIYRYELVTAGQASPSGLGKAVAFLIKQKLKDKTLPARPLKIVDIGCGLGMNMKLICELLPHTFISIYGIDWSPATFELHKSNPDSIYDEILLCDSTELPYHDNEFDIALSMENLEHLYGDGCIRSLEEMKRISKHLVITTPLPFHVINFSWIYPELIEAILDQIQLKNHDYICLESAVHKSTIFPKSMLEAGFSVEAKTHGVYFGISKDIDIKKISYIGIDPLEDQYFNCNQQKYIFLLAKSAKLLDEITKHDLYETPPLTIASILCFLKACINKIKIRLQ